VGRESSCPWRAEGFNIYGLDIDPRTIHLAKILRNLETVEIGNWQRLPDMEGWGDFDVVMLFDTLEHVAAPVSMVSTVFRLLKRNGIVCISVPQLDRFPRVFDIDVDLPPHHLTLWTEKALTNLLREAGFEQIRVVQKPLLLEDLLSHLMLRGRRHIREVRKDEIDSVNDKKGPKRQDPSVHPHPKRQWKPMVTKTVLHCCRPADWFLEITHLGRGPTLLATATRPA